MRHRFLALTFTILMPLQPGFTQTTMPTTSKEPVWVNPQPDIPYLPKPATRPANWIVEHDPVVPDTSPEARALLKFLYAISGKHTLTGQHNYAAEQHYSTDLAIHVSHKTPAIYGTDWGFAAEGDKDSAYVRQATVDTLIAEYRKGSIITICWHEVRPTEDEPVTFRHSIRGKLTDEEFEDVITPGTKLYQRWCAQVDEIAVYMKQLQTARIPILFRPYHEMNGDWFWWSGRRGQRGTMQLYRQIFNRMVHYHHLNNLIWVWNVDRPMREDRQFVDYFPGQQYVDVLAFDDYGPYLQTYYDDMNALSDGKVMAIAETSHPPAMSVYKTQPKWTWWMRWAIDRPRRTTSPTTESAPTIADHPTTVPATSLAELVSNPRMFSLDDPAYWNALAPVRAASGLPSR